MKRSILSTKPSFRKRLIVMSVAVAVLFALLIGYNTFKGHMIAKFMKSMGNPPQTVSTMTVSYMDWQPTLEAYGNVRAVHGVHLAFDVPGLVKSIDVKSGDDVRQGQALVELVDDQDRANLEALRAKTRLAELTADRAKQQLAVQAISQAAYDAAIADLKDVESQADAQAALVSKKTLRAPFTGRIGIITANPGQYIREGDIVVGLQQLDPVYVDFHLPQSAVHGLCRGSKVEVTADGFDGKVFVGEVNAIDPEADVDTRNIRVEATLANSEKLLVPGMFTHVTVVSGKPRKYLTLPQTAITYAPYGNTVFVVHAEQVPKRSTKAKPVPGEAEAAPPQIAGESPEVSRFVQQVVVNTGQTRGDQVAILSGIKEGDVIVTSGQLKLKNGTPIAVNNRVQPSFNPNPHPLERQQQGS